MKIETVLKIMKRQKREGRYGSVPDDAVLHQLARWARKATSSDVRRIVEWSARVGGKVYAVGQCTIAGAHARRAAESKR